LLSNLIFVYAIIIALALIIFSTATIECKVNGGSMKPTYNNIANKNDYVYVNKFNDDYKYGDVIVIYTDSEPIIKRIVGLPGDVIDIVLDEEAGVYRLERNGQMITENYIYHNGYSYETISQNGMDRASSRFEDYKEKNKILLNNDYKLIIRDGEVFALGDNRRISSDSSELGAFDFEDIAGIVESDRLSDKGLFQFYYDYIIKGQFFFTLINIF
jgi:signal peptidase I